MRSSRLSQSRNIRSRRSWPNSARRRRRSRSRSRCLSRSRSRSLSRCSRSRSRLLRRNRSRSACTCSAPYRTGVRRGRSAALPRRSRRQKSGPCRSWRPKPEPEPPPQQALQLCSAGLGGRRARLTVSGLSVLIQLLLVLLRAGSSRCSFCRSSAESCSCCSRRRCWACRCCCRPTPCGRACAISCTRASIRRGRAVCAGAFGQRAAALRRNAGLRRRPPLLYQPVHALTREREGLTRTLRAVCGFDRPLGVRHVPQLLPNEDGLRYARPATPATLCVISPTRTPPRAPSGSIPSSPCPARWSPRWPCRALSRWALCAAGSSCCSARHPRRHAVVRAPFPRWRGGWPRSARPCAARTEPACSAGSTPSSSATRMCSPRTTSPPAA